MTTAIGLRRRDLVDLGPAAREPASERRAPSLDIGSSGARTVGLVERMRAGVDDRSRSPLVTRERGPQGIPGEPGLPGPPGKQGDVGPVGPAAYSILSAWVPDTAYFNAPPVSSVIALDTVWVCASDHTSGTTFETDLALGRWVSPFPKVTGRYGGTF